MFDVSCVAMRYVDLCYLFCVLCRCVPKSKLACIIPLKKLRKRNTF